MEPKNENHIKEQLKSLFNVLSDKDLNGNNPLKMSDFFNVFINEVLNNVYEDNSWKEFDIPEEFFEHMKDNIIFCVEGYIKERFFDSKYPIILLNKNDFSKKIKEGLVKGVYYIEKRIDEMDQKEFTAIVDRSGKVIQKIAVSASINPTRMLMGMSVISIYSSLKIIENNTDNINIKVEELKDDKRRSEKNNLLNAIDRMKMASNSDDIKEINKYLYDAEKYLSTGSQYFYSDLEEKQVKELANIKGKENNIKNIDLKLKYINEDLMMISRFLGLRLYILNIFNKKQDIKDIMEKYRYTLEGLLKNKINNSGYSAFEIIHNYYPYNEDNMDFWIKQPKEIIKALSLYEDMIDIKDRNVFYISADTGGEING